MKVTYASIFVGVTMLTAIPVSAYTYTFTNRSDKDAEVEFKLSLDIAAGFPTQTMKVAAHKSESMTIPDWYRAGLCIDYPTIRIKFGDGAFKRPWGYSRESYFEEVVKNHTLPKIPRYKETNPKLLQDENNNAEFLSQVYPDGRYYSPDNEVMYIMCSNAMFEFTYDNKNTHPVIYWRR